MLDSFFNKGFKAAKCKTLLKLTIPRIKLLRNRREIQLKQMRKDIANLLANGQEATARIRVEHIIREENMMAAQDIIELFCELITVRLPIIEIQRECPLDLKEAISSICFAAPRCADLPELLQVQLLFAAKYGKEFVAAATELMPDCGVNRQIIELLSVRAPSAEIKVTLLKQIAEEHGVDWDPAATESEFLKPHEDLLNGPGQIISGSSMALPLPKEKQIPFSKAAEETYQESAVDPGLDSWDLPEVPKSSVQSNLDSPPEEVWTPPLFNSKGTEPSSTVEAESKSPNYSLIGSENNQFVPFVPPPLTPAASSPSFHAKRAESAASPPTFEIKPNAKEEDLQDVLAAAQAAAESAERAAAAARAAASLAQLRFSEISKKKKDVAFDGIENEASDGMENPIWSQHKLPDDAKHTPLDLSSQELLSENKEVNSRLDYNEIREPRRSISMEDDPYYSYPNLFSRQESFHHTKFTSSDNSQQAHDT